MGITISYRGRLADLTRIEDFEDRLLDLVLELGGLAQIWRSYPDRDPERVVRGMVLNLAPGLETTSLLISPEGWLVGVGDIEEAELGRLKEPPWCFTQTQFGPIEGHVALVEMLAVLQREFLTELEVSDEGGYWETRDLAELVRRRSRMQETVGGVTEGLQGLTAEAAEDPETLLRRIKRIAAQVTGILRRPAEHPPVTFPDDDDFGVGQDRETTEALWDEMFKHNRRNQERMQRAIEERRSRGEDDGKAFDKALNDLALEVPGEESWLENELEDEDDQDPFAESLEDEAELDEAWTGDSEEDNPFAAEEERHPLLKETMNLLKDLHTLFQDADPKWESWLRGLFQGTGDVMGGLVQALSTHDDDIEDYGLRVVQLKRALRGVAFAHAGIRPLQAAITPEQHEGLAARLGQLEKDILGELSRVRSEYRP